MRTLEYDGAGAGSRALVVIQGRPGLPVAVSRAQHGSKPFAEWDEFDGMGRKIGAGLLVIAMVFGGMGALSTMATLDGAVLALGSVQVESGRKPVQHAEGGVVKEVLVRDGDMVKEGDLLIRLSDKAAGASLRLIQGQVAELAIRRARLIAERDDKDELQVPGNVQLGKTDKGLLQIVESQRALLTARRQNKRAELELLRQQQIQIRAQIAGLKEQSASKERQVQLFDDELKDVRALVEKGKAPKSKLLTLERAAEANRGEQAGLTGGVAALELRINELELQILKLGTQAQEKVADELRTVEAEMNTNAQRLLTSQDQAERTELRSPHAGRVSKLTVQRRGAVIKPGDTVMEIVPDDDALVITAQVQPQDIDKIQAGQKAKVRLPAFNQRTTPQLDGNVQLVSADLISDPVTGRPFYRATVSIPLDQMKLLPDGLVLKPGMPAETTISTGDRSPMSYLWKPVVDRFARALRQD